MGRRQGDGTDRAGVLQRVLLALGHAEPEQGRTILAEQYPFQAAAREERRITPMRAMPVFVRDGFVDRYSGDRLVFPGVFRLISLELPDAFPCHPNWKVSETHPAYWELFPTIDHMVPVARCGADDPSNWVTTSQLRNSAKAHWTLEELGWTLRPPGDWAAWDGLTGTFLRFVNAEPRLLEDGYVRRWHRAAIACQPAADAP